ncbi:hypothetical protein B7L09_21060 [Pseudomonas mandelii]|jgi:hypothetical protein|nr:hypothetical protein B7L09_21060 [Pseudomonas mandelii]
MERITVNYMDVVMTLYEDEWMFWDDIAGRYILKHASNDPNTANIIDAAAYYADSMVVARRKRKRVKLPVSGTAVDTSNAPTAL